MGCKFFFKQYHVFIQHLEFIYLVSKWLAIITGHNFSPDDVIDEINFLLFFLAVAKSILFTIETKLPKKNIFARLLIVRECTNATICHLLFKKMATNAIIGK